LRNEFVSIRNNAGKNFLLHLFVTIQSQGSFQKFANHACMNEHNFENFFGEVTTMSK